MKVTLVTLKRSLIAAFFLVPVCFSINMNGQSQNYTWFYRVYFNDKGENTINKYASEDLLSERAIARRLKYNLPCPDYKDLPVSDSYISQIKSSGLVLHCTSKWMNSALFKSVSEINTGIIKNLPFVNDIKVVKHPVKSASFNNKLDFSTNESDIPPFDSPVTMLNGSIIHSSGFDGRGVLIAILDGGFLWGDLISSTNNLRKRNGIKATYNFVQKNKWVYLSSTHGTAVLSILAGDISGIIKGTATGADYLLLRTEDIDSEFPCEEDFWVAGAEFADSSGADIITSSLGYYNFDDPSMNYKDTDLDGNSAFITIAADIAASKGILVVNSAGNERAKAWKKIIFPSDGDSVLAAGAVDGNNTISSFSSAGPAYDRRIKPDLSALGVSVPQQTSVSTIGRANGTSFSCPILSGMAACLMQAVPGATNGEVIIAMQRSGDRYLTPDSLYGYGIPDLLEALTILQDKYIKTPISEIIVAPNPSNGNFELIFKQAPGKFSIELFSATGKTLLRKDYPDWAGRTVSFTALQNHEQGIYFVRIVKSTGTEVIRIIKINN